ncbi:D-glycero-alpha-D-manno-heptose-1,7-bisphosphate 7-phosphatase [Salipaludibacillus sp. HK11]|uniref:D-glycero-alpha-D-manno-heptose-1,7-bisphosphate 7-phosphatase n=1 Tax=Salipaludibacillus sp. HK11 TaxID=3394320 RepID=UPI0039FD3040
MNKAMFLDRDGVINEVLSERVEFVNEPDDFHLLEGVGEAVRLFNEAGFKVFVVTNQGGIGLGFMGESALTSVHTRMENDLAVFGARVDDIAYCAHKPHEQCACRKPKPEMILRLAEKYDVDLGNSYMVGDRAPDIEAGKAAGTKTILVGEQKTGDAGADFVFPDLLSAAWAVCKRE